MFRHRRLPYAEVLLRVSMGEDAPGPLPYLMLGALRHDASVKIIADLRRVGWHGPTATRGGWVHAVGAGWGGGGRRVGQSGASCKQLRPKHSNTKTHSHNPPCLVQSQGAGSDVMRPVAIQTFLTTDEDVLRCREHFGTIDAAGVWAREVLPRGMFGVSAARRNAGVVFVRTSVGADGRVKLQLAVHARLCSQAEYRHVVYWGARVAAGEVGPRGRGRPSPFFSAVRVLPGVADVMEDAAAAAAAFKVGVFQVAPAEDEEEE